MERPKRVLFVQGRGRQPEVQATFGEQWRLRGLEVVHERIHWRGNDYQERLTTLSGRIIQLAEEGDVSLLGVSAGGKAVLSLFAEHPNIIHRVVLVNSKIPPYETTATWLEDYPNIKASSLRLEKDLERITPEMRARVLCARSETDETMEPDTSVLVLPQAHVYDMRGIHGHPQGIEHALTGGRERPIEFICQQEVEYPIAV